MTQSQSSPAESRLFEPIKVGDVQLKHRVAMAPLTRMRALGNQIRDIHATYYGQRASEPGTLIISEATIIKEPAGGHRDAPGIWSQKQIEGWKKVIDAVHEKGSAFFVQIWALGRAAEEDVMKERGLPYVSASALKKNPDDESAGTPRPLSADEIQEYVAWFAQAAKNAIAAGADGVEIHAANGYLLDQFQHANSNVRTDAYGGSIENRARFTLEVVDAVTAAVGAHRTAIRLSPWGVFNGMDSGVSPIPQFSYIVAELQRRANEGRELAYVHLIEPRYVFLRPSATEWVEFTYVEGSNDFVRAIWKGVLVRAGGFDLQQAKDAVAEDDKLIIGVGRDFIATPDLVKRWKHGIKLNPHDRSTYYTSDEVGYTDLPFAEDITASA